MRTGWVARAFFIVERFFRRMKNRGGYMLQNRKQFRSLSRNRFPIDTSEKTPQKCRIKCSGINKAVFRPKIRKNKTTSSESRRFGSLIEPPAYTGRGEADRRILVADPRLGHKPWHCAHNPCQQSSNKGDINLSASFFHLFILRFLQCSIHWVEWHSFAPGDTTRLTGSKCPL